MKNYLNKITPLVLISFLLISFVMEGKSQGRMVRGAEKTEYALPTNLADFYVSPKGSDAWSGKLAEPNKNGTDGPFATIAKAKEAVRLLKLTVYKPKKKAVDPRFKGTPHLLGTGRDILVLIRGGVYSLDKGLEFTAADGGERVETDLPTGAFEYHELKDYYVTYAAYPGEKAIISGGEKITGWTKENNGAWKASIQKEGINDLYANGKRLTLARTPNSGFFYTEGQPTDSFSFQFKTGDLKSWNDIETNRIHMTVRWSGIHTSMARVDEKNNTAYLASSAPDMLIVPPKYYVENLAALMDTTNEWFYNKKNNTIHFIPSEEIKDPNLSEVSFPKLSNLLSASGTREKPIRNLRFYNLNFQNTLAGGGGTVTFQYAKNCELLKNTIENVSQAAIHFGIGSYHNLISRNIINDSKGSGIIVAGEPKPENWEDVVSDNTISFNKITNVEIAATGISTYNAIRSTVSNNYINNVGSYGITLGSWPNIEETSDGSHLAEFNHVSFTNMKRDDEGGIAVYGLSPGSVVRNNLIHDVHPAETNENVALFFQNMSSGWKVYDNTYYNLKQGEMKLCACYLVDNFYENNIVVESPKNKPEEIIEGAVKLSYTNLAIKPIDAPITGHEFLITANISNAGSTGMEDIYLYVDGKVVNAKKLPFLANNDRKIEFKYKFCDPGKHIVAIGKSSTKEIVVKGNPIYLIYRNLQSKVKEIPAGDSLEINTEALNMRAESLTQKIVLTMDGKITASQSIHFQENESKQIRFSVLPSIGFHTITIGDQPPIKVHVYPVQKIDISKLSFLTYTTTTAKPSKFNFDAKQNHFEITAAGTDFLHAEDSYGTIYLKQAIEGNFVATVKVVGFSEGISEWFRAGIFIRNDLSKGDGMKPATLGSFLLFSTTKRCGAQWDEFGDGCMHNTKSKNYGVDNPIPVWIKLVRHGNSFTGYYSLDGKNWTISRESGDIPGMATKMDIGLAGGANDQKVSTVTFEDFQLSIEKK
jgi:regulation of enolase protein 1 (concanavalin A-like superfamily)